MGVREGEKAERIKIALSNIASTASLVFRGLR